MKLSEYLIDRGWLPSPTTRAQGAWEHPQLSLIPDGAFPGLYEPDECRWEEGAALALQLVCDRQALDAPLKMVWRISEQVSATAGYIAKWMPR